MTTLRRQGAQAPTLHDIDHVKDLLDRLRLDRAARRTGAVIVEGPTDGRVLSEVLADKSLSFFPVAGRPNVLKSAEYLQESYLPGVICVCDADFDDAVPAYAGHWFLVFTDNADIETMVFFSPALDRFLREWASSEKLADLGGAPALRMKVRDSLELLSTLRSSNAKRGLGITFDAFDLHDVVDRDTLELKRTGLLARLAHSSGVGREVVENSASADSPMCHLTGEPLVKGRDCFIVTGVALRKLLASLPKQKVEGGLVEKSLRMALRPGDLEGKPFIERFKEALRRALAIEAT